MKLDPVFIIGFSCLINNFWIVESAPKSRFTETLKDNDSVNESTHKKTLEDDKDDYVNDNEEQNNDGEERSNDEVSINKLEKSDESINLRSWRKKRTTDNRYKELTISMPKFKTDVMGNWVYNPWAITFGDLYRDTNYNFATNYPVTRMTVDANYAKGYYPVGYKLSTVCMEKSTEYNDAKNKNWLKGALYHYVRWRNLMRDLRLNIYKNNNPYQCHSAEYVNFLDYIECAMLRHMRLESKIPKYPRHQILPEGTWFS